MPSRGSIVLFPDHFDMQGKRMESGNSLIAAAVPQYRAGEASDDHPGIADILVSYLESIGVEFVFGIPGGAIEPLFDALARSERRGGLRHVLARHEAGAAFMADGYARETGRLGVCCATSGPGATNLITGVSCAFDNGIPLLVITGQPALPTFGRGPLQESACTGINTLGMFEHCTLYNSLVSHPKQFETKLIAALQRATRAPRGPVHLSMPIDVFRSPSPRAAPSYDLRNLLQPSALIDDGAVRALGQRLDAAKKIVVLVGGWCGEAIGEIRKFVEARHAVLVTTPDGKGLVSPHHPRFRGVFGFGGHASAESALLDPEVDLVLVVGANMGEWNSGGWSEVLLNERLAHIDESEEHLARTPMACLHVRGRILTVFERLNATGAGRAPITRGRRAAAVACPSFVPPPGEQDGARISPAWLMQELGRRCPPTTRFLADTGNSTSWAVHYLNPVDRRVGERRTRDSSCQRENAGGWLRVTMNFAPMGWAIGGAIGTAIANRAAPVVCITGDGSMLMNGQELSVAVAEGLRVIFVVLNDGALGMVKHGQRMAGAEQTGCDLPPTDFAALARALGAPSHTLRTAADIEALDLAAICAHDGPALLDVHVDPDQVPPMNVRMKVLSAARWGSSRGRS
ncbi:MAG TPA: thiamine pyrophosphate-binding protein [Rhodocyclaceae bacterium]